MTAAMFLVGPRELDVAGVGDLVALAGPEGHHAVGVKRVTVGERIDLADGRGTLVRAEVAVITGRDALSARVLDREVVPAPAPRIVVVQALPKGDRGETAVETLTEVGADVIVPWQAERCIARWADQRADRGVARWAATARAAGKQARRSWLPEVRPLARTSDVEALVRSAAGAVVLHEEARLPIRELAVPAAGDLVLVVGPEGGVSSSELDRLTAAGAVPVRMGPSVMRTSTAGTVAVGIVLASTARWA